MNSTSMYLTVAAAALFLSMPGRAAADSRQFQDPLDVPSVQRFGAQKVTSQPLMAIANAGGRIVAVGLRGLVIFSDDNGRSWRQARVPVQTDLVAVQFVTPRQGWASGHDAVILHTEDGGESWTKQFDNRLAAVVLPAYYERRLASGDASVAPLLKEVQLNTQGDTSLPFLSVYFSDLQHGFAVGSFGMIVATEDGGKHWLPWLDHIDNKGYLNLNSIRKIGDDLIIAGEQGSVYRYDEKAKSFVAISTPYKGSFFDITGTNSFMLAVGLRGTAFRSVDKGSTWQHIETPVKDTITSASVSGRDDEIVLTTSGGALLVSSDHGLTFRESEVSHPMLLTAVSTLKNGWVVLAGLQGVDMAKLDAGQPAMSSEDSQ